MSKYDFSNKLYYKILIIHNSQIEQNKMTFH